MDKNNVVEIYKDIPIFKGTIGPEKTTGMLYMPEASRGDLYLYLGPDISSNRQVVRNGDEFVCVKPTYGMHDWNFIDTWNENWVLIGNADVVTVSK